MADTPVFPAPATIALAPGARAWFVSDLHLWLDRPRTLERFRACLARAVREAQTLFILGDLFEYWAGDDDLASPAVAPVVAALRAAADAGLEISFMHGNRDFLAGAGFAAAAGVRLLPDACIVCAGPRRVLALHGDLLCTDDLDYQRFRAQVRRPDWQAQFLARPLAERHALIANMRAHSEARKAQTALDIMDVNADAVAHAYAHYGVDCMIHGHTHRPARHDLPQGPRWVLPDWEYDTAPHRGGGLMLAAAGITPRDA